MQEEWISVRDLATQLGRSRKGGKLLLAIRNKFPKVIQKVRIGNVGHSVWAVPKSECKVILNALGYSGPVINSLKPQRTIRQSAEHEVAKKFQDDGYTTIVTKDRGTPDVIAFRKRSDDGFDLVFREVKGLSDSLHKEQYEVLARLRASGVGAEVQWIEN